ncbi:MAG: ester cyclase [Pleurocapsa minor GSE-CHR-MK-17-07R]|jgi:predicted ester cyclase|nr:ester cyclase [Pleurocapsa minor GSE-CHR-MK 17-07R]
MNAVRFVKQGVLLLVCAFALTTASFIAAQDAAPEMQPGVMSVEDAERFADRFDEVFNIPDLDVLDEIFSQDYVGHLPFAPELDLQGLKDYIDTFRAGVPDMVQETHQVIIGEHELVVRVTYTGTHTGTLFGVPATGNPIVMEGIGILRFDDDGLVVENWAVLDMGGVFAQIGIFPPA